jgi:hypothetical protein
MRLTESRLDMTHVATARTLLTTPARRDPMWPALIAATALAVSSVMFAAVAVLAPPVKTEHVATGAPD